MNGLACLLGDCLLCYCKMYRNQKRPFKPYSSHLLVQPSTPPTLHPRVGLEHLQSEGHFLLESPGQKRAYRNLLSEGEPLYSPYGTLPLAEEVRFPILSPPTSQGAVNGASLAAH